MKIQIIAITFLLLLSCKNQSNAESENINVEISKKEILEESIEFTHEEIDSLIRNEKLTKKFYPNMSYFGGALNGFYYNNHLVFIDAIYQGELSYTRKKMYVSNSGFSKIIYQEHFPEMEKYEKKYPLDKYDYDPNKVTFADTIYEINIGLKNGFKKTYLNKVLSTESDSTLIKRLLKCGERMKTELKTITE